MNTFEIQKFVPKKLLILPSNIESQNRDNYELVVNLRFMAQHTNSISVQQSEKNGEQVSNIYLKDVEIEGRWLPKMEYPQDHLVTTKQTVFYNPNLFSEESLKSEFDNRKFVGDRILSEGGRYAFGDGLVFLGMTKV
ncbi:MAG: hypothetical protein ABI721_05620 [Candidatus Dojkabacteria bacterium]